MGRYRLLVVCLGCVALVACGSEPVDAPQSSTPSSEWRLSDVPYPFVGNYGEVVCAEWTRELPGEAYVDRRREFYHFDRMNDQLAARSELEPGVREAIFADGIREVSTCEDARRFLEIKHAYLEAQPSEPAQPNTETPLPEPIDKVRDSDLYDHLPTVRLRIWKNGEREGGCTGVLLNAWSVLTAAHCFPADGSYGVSIDFGNRFGSAWCISNNHPDCDSAPSPQNMLVMRHPNWTGTEDASFDVAVGVELDDEPWAVIGNDSNYFMRLLLDDPPLGTQYRVHGYGAQHNDGSGAGDGRRSKLTDWIEWKGANYWLSYADPGWGSTCRGDSGSSAVNTSLIGDREVSLGVASLMDVNNDETDYCTKYGGKFRYSRINNKANWVRGVLEAFGAGTCTTGLRNGWLYRFCW